MKNELIKLISLLLSFVFGYIMCEIMMKLNDNSKSGHEEFNYKQNNQTIYQTQEKAIVE